MKVDIRTTYYTDKTGCRVPYLVAPPARPDQDAALVLYLHGCYREPLDQQKLLQLTARSMAGFVLAAASAGENVVFAAPLGYGNSRFEGLGAADVLRVLGDVSTALSIAPRRVSLLGTSMGGYGALRLAMEAPDRFCSVGSIGGYLDPEHWPFPAGGTPEPWQHDYLEASSLRLRVGNLVGLRVVVRHSADDLGVGGGVPFTESQDLAQRCRAEGVDLDYEEWPRTDHEMITAAERLAVMHALLVPGRADPPAAWTWSGRWSRGSSAYGIERVVPRAAGRPVRLQYSRSGPVVTLCTHNVRWMSLKAGGAERIEVDGQPFATGDATDGVVSVRQYGDSWQFARTVDEPAGGPIGDVLDDHVAFVVPSSGRQVQQLRALAVAERRRLLETHGGRGCGPYRRGVLLDAPPVMTDQEFMQSDWPANAILYGDPEDNPALRAYVTGTPVPVLRQKLRGSYGERCCLRARLPQVGPRVVVVNLGRQAWDLAGGFVLDYGRSPGFIAFCRESIVQWGSVDDGLDELAAQGAGV